MSSSRNWCHRLVNGPPKSRDNDVEHAPRKRNIETDSSSGLLCSSNVDSKTFLLVLLSIVKKILEAPTGDTIQLTATQKH